MLSLIVGAWLIERSDVPVAPATWAIAGAAIGGVLFAGSLAEQDYMSEPGLFAGALAALIGFAASRVFLGGAEERLSARGESDAGTTLNLIADGAVLAVRAALAVLVEPSAYLAVAFCAWVLVVQRRRAGRSTKASEYCVDEARTRARGRPEARDARAGGRRWARAAVRRDHASWSVLLRLRQRVPVGDSGGGGIDHHGHGFPTSTVCRPSAGTTAGRAATSTTGPRAGSADLRRVRTITDTVHNMNFDHLSRSTPTVFEQLEDAGVRTACTPFLIYRGRTRHEMGLQGWIRRVAQAANLRQAVYGPAELFYGELYASQDVDARRRLRDPARATPTPVAWRLHRALRPVRLPAALAAGQRPLLPPARATGDPCVHRARGRCLQQLVERPGARSIPERSRRDPDVGPFPVAVTRRIQLAEALSDWRVLQPNDPDPESADLAVAPGARSAMVYALAEDGARERLRARVLRRLRSVEGVDLLAWMEGGEACLWSDRGELRFTPGTQPDRSPPDDLGPGREPRHD